MSWTRFLGVLGCALGFALALTSPALAQSGRPSWVAAWGLPVNYQDTTSFSDQTVRVVARPSIGGSRVRIRLSNADGTQPVTLADAHIGVAGAGAAISGANVPLTFNHSSTVTIPAGGAVLSDPAHLHVTALQNIAVSVYVPSSTGPGTGDGEMSSYYTASGDHASDSSAASFGSSSPGGWFVTGVDVWTPNDGLIVGLGDSITVGYNASDQGWPYWLANRLVQLAAHGGPAISVIDMGISGNQVTGDLAGVSAQDRLQRDVLDQTGLKGVLMMEGINDIGDIGNTAPGGVPAIEAGLASIVGRVRAAGAGILLSPLTPAGDAANPEPYGGMYSTDTGIQERFAVNNWIRRNSTAYNPLFDFEPVVENPLAPNELLPAFDSGDHLHPNIPGQQAMADSIPLRLIERLAETEQQHHRHGLASPSPRGRRSVDRPHRGRLIRR